MPEIAGWNVIPALVILLREIAVSGLREFLAGLRLDSGQQARQVEDDVPAGLAGRLILGGAMPDQPWVHDIGLVCLWAAAALTLITGWDYLRVGLKHMD